LRELALHILDIAENSISAGAKHVAIKIDEDLHDDYLKISIKDDGKGMDQETLTFITDPFVTSRTTRNVGLGIPFFKAAAEACEGSFEIQSEPGVGTLVDVSFKHSHIDRMPLGNITDTMLALVIGCPEVNWVFEYHFNDQRFIFDNQPIKEALDGVPLSEPAVMKFIRQTFEEGIKNVKQDEQLSILY
jgi:anti-sigma regulatory factor (Ser/Thr protein kinase)